VSLTEGDLARLNWRKAKRSVNAGACVEVASAATAVVVRDSLEVYGPVLRYPTAAWQLFLDSASAGRYDAVRP
jgi:Domain of unknown function (DUF397)